MCCKFCSRKFLERDSSFVREITGSYKQGRKEASDQPSSSSSNYTQNREEWFVKVFLVLILNQIQWEPFIYSLDVVIQRKQFRNLEFYFVFSITLWLVVVFTFILVLFRSILLSSAKLTFVVVPSCFRKWNAIENNQSEFISIS